MLVLDVQILCTGIMMWTGRAHVQGSNARPVQT